jgi:hypothetical protein
MRADKVKLTSWSEKMGPGVWKVDVTEDVWRTSAAGYQTQKVLATHTIEGVNSQRKLQVIARRLMELEEIKQGANNGNET